MKPQRSRQSSFRVLLVAAVAFLPLMLEVDGSLAQQPGTNTFRLLTFEVGNSGPRLGTTRGDGEQDIVDVHNAVLYLTKTGAPEVSGLAPIPIDMRSLIEAGDASVRSVKTVHDAITRVRASGNFTEPGGAARVFHPPAGVRYLPPIPNPSKVLGGAGAYLRPNPDGTPGNYDNVEFPSFFLKPPSSLTGHNTDINLRGLLTRGVYEPECAVIIKKRAKFVPQSEVMDYVFGFTNFNDVSSRDLPAGEHTSQGSNMSKGLDTFTPLGPYITLAEDVPDPANLEIVATVDGARHEWPHKNGNTKFLTFSLEESISYLSERMTLEPGDVVSTGVPSPSMPFAAGETIEISIGNLGTLRNRVVSEPYPGWSPIQPRKAHQD
ncbi:MAG TPA: fumarylacetoacetate hydrolase family protein [Vicinamibacteria bacterium]|nr:fumarylacetoacetate hydrolase family protein [Vicinamibacteria bacterium]